jgi:hypothetical protein
VLSRLRRREEGIRLRAIAESHTGTPQRGKGGETCSSGTPRPRAWLDWQQSTDDTDPQSEILYDVYLNGVRNDDGVIGYGSTITYCREPGPTTIVIKAVDTSGNVSAPSNEIIFNC